MIAAFLLESLVIAFVGGLVGCVAVLPINGMTTDALNWQTFSQLAFAFRVTPDLLLKGLLFALFMGFWGGLLPSIRAARLPIATTLRNCSRGCREQGAREKGAGERNQDIHHGEGHGEGRSQNG